MLFTRVSGDSSRPSLAILMGEGKRPLASMVLALGGTGKGSGGAFSCREALTRLHVEHSSTYFETNGIKSGKENFETTRAIVRLTEG